MKHFITIFLILSILTTCSTNRHDSSKDAYIKVIIVGDAINPSAYNKGLGMQYYSYFDLNTDSLYYLYTETQEIDDKSTYVNHAYHGKLDNPNYRDTLLQLIQSLKSRPSGSIGNITQYTVYCGWEYLVEIKKENEVNFYAVTAGVSDTLDKFFNFFIRLKHMPWTKSPANPKDINIDNEVVSAMKRFGSYENREVPYLFPICDNGIDFKKLVGRWRKVGDDFHSIKKDRFLSYILLSDSTFSIEKYTYGKSELLVKGTYSVDLKARKIIYIDKDGYKLYQTITQLTDSCISGFQATQKSVSTKIKLNRY